jgi:hypothetical protein
MGKLIFTPPPTCVTVAQLCGKFEANGTVQNVDKEHSEDLTVQLLRKVF